MTTPKKARDKEFFLEIIGKWKTYWMNQKQNSEQDYQNYFRRALGVDANMGHSLAKMIVKSIESEAEIDSFDHPTMIRLKVENEKLREALGKARTDTINDMKEWLKQRSSMFTIHDPVQNNIAMAINALDARMAIDKALGGGK